MNIISKFLALLSVSSVIAFSPAAAAGWWEPAAIKRISVNPSGVAFLRLEPTTFANGYTPAACSTNGYWQTVFDVSTPAGQAMLSLALSAKLSGTPVRVIGNGNCAIFSSIEGTAYIDILPSN